eukprot:3940953-Rhodomonas_salina.1
MHMLSDNRTCYLIGLTHMDAILVYAAYRGVGSTLFELCVGTAAEMHARNSLKALGEMRYHPAPRKKEKTEEKTG